MKKILSLLTVTSTTLVAITTTYAQASTSSKLTAAFLEQHPIVYARVSGVYYKDYKEGRGAPGEANAYDPIASVEPLAVDINCDNLKLRNKNINDSDFLYCLGILEDKNNAKVTIKILTSRAGLLEFSGNLQLGESILKTADGEYSLDIRIAETMVDLDLIGSPATLKSVPAYTIYTGRDITKTRSTTLPSATLRLKQSDFEQHPIVYIPDSTKEKIALGRHQEYSPVVSVEKLITSVGCSRLNHGFLSGIFNKYICLGLIQDVDNAKVTVLVPTQYGGLKFSGRLRAGTMELEASLPNGRRYRLEVKIEKTTSNIVLGTESFGFGAIGTSVDAYKISYGKELTEVYSPKSEL